MSITAEGLIAILNDLGFATVAGTDATVDEQYAIDLTALEALDLAGEVPQKVVTSRTVQLKNEYHDETLTQVQAICFDDLCGLGSVKALGEKVASALCGEGTQIELRPEFIYQVAPAIEMKVAGTAFAAGGMLRPELLKRRGLNIAEKSIYAVMFVVESAARL